MLLAHHAAIFRQNSACILAQACGHLSLDHGIRIARFGGGGLVKISLQCCRYGFERIALGQLWQTLAILIALAVIAAFLIDFEKPVEQNNLTRGAQHDLLIIRADLDGGALHAGGLHLAGDGALPDQIIELALIFLGQADVIGRFGHFRGADTFMRFLCVFGFVFVHARRGGHIVGPVARLDCVACIMDRFGGHIDAIGSHICDMPRLIETLRCTHGLPRAHAEFAAGLLLQGRGHEGRRGVAIGRFCLNRLNAQAARGDGLDRQRRLRGIAKVIFIELLARQNL